MPFEMIVVQNVDAMLLGLVLVDFPLHPRWVFVCAGDVASIMVMNVGVIIEADACL